MTGHLDFVKTSPGMTATYSHGGPEWDGKLREAVTRLDQAFRLSYERKAVAAAVTQVPDFSGEPPGTRTQGPRLKRANRSITIGCDRERGSATIRRPAATFSVYRQ